MGYIVDLPRQLLESARAAEALAVPNLVYKTAGGYWAQADANATSKYPALGVVLVGASIGAIPEVASDAEISGFSGLTPGGAVYLSETAGGITQTAPAMAQVVGYAVDTTTIQFEIRPASVASAILYGSDRTTAAGGAQITNSRGTTVKATSIDHPTPRPRFTDAKCLMCVVLDDGSTDVSTVHSDGCDINGYSMLTYAQLKGVPLTIAAYAARVLAGAGIPNTDLKNFLKKVGGEVGLHSYSHTDVLTDAEMAQVELIDAKTALETTLGFPVRSFYHTGAPQNMNVNEALPSTALGRAARENLIAIRETGADNYVQGFPLMSRYPTRACTNLCQGVGDPEGSTKYRRYINQFANTPGSILSFYTHYAVKTDPSTAQITCAQWKVIIDTIAACMDAGTVECVPLWQMAYTYPTYRPNLILNGDFEYVDSGAGDDEFSHNFTSTGKLITANVAGASTIAIDTGDKHGGSNSLKMVKDGTNGCNIDFYKIQVIPGENYTLRWWQKCVEGAGQTYVEIGPTGGTFTNYFAAGSANWEQKRWTFAAPIDCHTILVRFKPANSTTLYLDDITLS